MLLWIRPPVEMVRFNTEEERPARRMADCVVDALFKRRRRKSLWSVGVLSRVIYDNRNQDVIVSRFRFSLPVVFTQ